MPDTKKEQLQKRIDQAKQKAGNRTTAVSYQTDTVKVTIRNYQTGAYFEPKTGRIVRNVTSHEKSQAQVRSEIAHEAKHAANAKSGIPDVSAEQFYKLQVMDETSAHIVSALSWREEYLKAEDKKKFVQDALSVNISSMWYPLDYVEAIADGTINPESKDPKDFDKEMAFIAKDAFNSMSSQSSGYKEQFTSITRGYMNMPDKQFAENDAEYARLSKQYMTIGGVDFRKYLDKDYDGKIYVPSDINSSSRNLAQSRDADQAQVLASGGLVYDGTISLEQYHKLLQHKAIADNIIRNCNGSVKESLLSGSHEKDGNINTSYDIFKQKSTYDSFQGKNSMEQAVQVGMALALNRADGNMPDNDAAFERKLKEIYTLPGTNVDLRDHIAGFNVDDVPLPDCPEIAEFMQDPEKYKAEHPYERNYQGVLEYNEGDVKWDEHDENDRVSDVENMEVFDSEGDFLQAERDQRELEQKMERLKQLEEKKKVEALSPQPKPLMTKMMDGMTVFFKGSTDKGFENAELKSVIDENGNRTDTSYLDGKKHGAEISKDKDGNITDIKLYDHGQEMDMSAHQVDVRSETREIDGKPTSVTAVTVDGKPFGAVVAEDENGIKADFYGKDGNRIYGKDGAEISASTEYVVSDEEQLQAQEQSAENIEPAVQQEQNEQSYVPTAENNEPAAEKEQTARTENNAERQDEPKDFSHQVSDTLQRGHKRVAEMRAKIAAGHVEKMSLSREESPAEQRLRELRFENSYRNQGTVTPTRINAQQLKQLLQRANE